MRQRGWWPTLAALLLGLAWVFNVPVVSGLSDPYGNWHPDEVSHVLTTRWWAEHFCLPTYNSDYAVSVHPAFYHIVGALFWKLGGALAVRIFSALTGAATVWFTFRAARALYGRQVGELAAWLVALVPMRASLSGGINNENLAALAATAALAVLAELLRGRRRRTLELALWCAVGVGSKLTCLGLFPAIFLAVGWRFGWLRAFKTTLVALLTTLVSMGWWFMGNISRCGDALCKETSDKLWDVAQPGYLHYKATRGFSPPRYLFSIAAFGWRSFWGTFDGLQKHLPMPLFLTLMVWQAAALWGAWQRGKRARRVRQAWLLAVLVLMSTTTLIYILYNWRHYTPQGRYFYVMLAPFGAISGYGFLALLPPARRRGAAHGLVITLAALNLWCLWYYRPGN